MTAEMYLPTFYVVQKWAMTTNRYQVLEAHPDRSVGRLMGLAEQKRLAFREKVTFYSDETRSRPVFGFKARSVVDLGGGYDIVDEGGRQLGFFRKDFGRSLLRSTFHLQGPGYVGSGAERSMAVALIRRFTDIPFLPIHFDFVDPQGRPLVTVERQGSVRDRYTVHVPHPEVDFRVAAALAVGLDALMQR